MKRFAHAFFVALLVVLLAAAGAVVYAVRHSSDIFINQIERCLGVKAAAAEVRYVFPSTILIRDLRVGDQLKADGLLVTPSIAGFFLKRAVVFNEILVTAPDARVVRRSDKTLDFGLPASCGPVPAPQGPPPQAPAAAAKKALPIYVSHLKVLNGRVTFIDEAVGTPPFRADLLDIRIEARRASLLEPLRLKVEAAARLEGENEEAAPGRLIGTGEYDLRTRNGTARLDVTDVALTLFEPYYVEYLQKRIQSGKATLGGDFRVDGNDLSGDCRLSLDGMDFQEPQAQEAGGTPSEQPQGASWDDVKNAAIPLLFSAVGEASFEFSFRTRLDRPRFENVKMKGVFAKPQSLGALAVEGAKAPSGEGFKKISEEFEALGRKFKEMFDF